MYVMKKNIKRAVIFEIQLLLYYVLTIFLLSFYLHTVCELLFSARQHLFHPAALILTVVQRPVLCQITYHFS